MATRFSNLVFNFTPEFFGSDDFHIRTVTENPPTKPLSISYSRSKKNPMIGKSPESLVSYVVGLNPERRFEASSIEL